MAPRTESYVLPLLESVDWAATSAGHRDGWPESLRTALNICVDSRVPMAIFWGPDYVQLYNDAYAAAILREKHPSLGERAQDCWTEIWPALGSLLDSVVRDARATCCSDLYLPIATRSAGEERDFSFSFSPIRTRDGVGGVLCIVTETTPHVFRERAGSERNARIADAMQSASLPRTLPKIPDLCFDAVYMPARAEARIGGDWYDAVRISGNRVVISIGDVTGSGLKAAVTMSSMRQVIRGIAQVHADPVLILDAADRALRLEEPDCFVTAFVGVLDPVAMVLSYASAGHPPPLLRLKSGEIRELDATGLPLGLRDENSHESETILLPDESVLVLYTDGLTEVRKRPNEGLAMLKERLRSDELLRAQNPARMLQESLLPFGSHDDVAVMSLSVRDRTRIRLVPKMVRADSPDSAGF